MGRDVEFLPDDANPYAPHSTSIDDHPGGRGTSDLGIFLRWEKLRLAYNAILGVVTILTLLGPHHGVKGSLSNQIISLIPHCLGANVCYCVGPVLEGYARRIGLRGEVVTGILFGLGTAFASLLARVAILGGID